MKRIPFLVSLLSPWISLANSSNSVQDNFVQCMSTKFSDPTKSPPIIFSQNSSSYLSILKFSIQNLRWLNSTKANPLIIITPSHESELDANRHLNWMTSLYEYMKPFVSNSPRAAYINYKDLDLGTNKVGNTSYSEAAVWGVQYFKENFKKWALVKSKVDPGNFFKNGQSIPPFPS